MTPEAQSITTKSVEIINSRLPGYPDLQRIWVDNQGIIRQILPMAAVTQQEPPTDRQVLDVAGDWISLGGVDLQINGALGLAFPDLNGDNAHLLPKICKFLWNAGVDGFLPTLVTTSVENIHRSLAVIANYLQLSPQREREAKILGVHLEGPFLNYEKRGAHPAEYLLPLSVEEVKRVLGDYGHIVKIMTLAPELDATGEAIAYLCSLGITVSLGHSQGTVDEAQRAFNQGASMVTHAFNAMPPLHHREPGLLAAAITDSNVMCGLIADGQHVSPTIIDILLRASNYEQGIFLVSDALAPLGLPDGLYPWDNRQIEVKNGTARLTNGILSGTTLPLLVGVQNLVKWGICDVETAIKLATAAPRKAIHLQGISLGQSANLLHWHLDADSQELSWRRLI
ncbi:MAG: N-acetylglucosamine-6-phosphate deacetylase [Nostocaceae cyanobacterium]|nr:N-acetylglucosamine-6-phosphate deacetylase [Nostocaceae cyanobacterium]